MELSINKKMISLSIFREPINLDTSCSMLMRRTSTGSRHSQYLLTSFFFQHSKGPFGDDTN